MPPAKRKTVASPEDQSPLGAQAIQRALRVLECFSVDQPAVSLTEITNATGLTMPTAHRIVKALQSNQFLTHDEITSKYSLGPALLRLAKVILSRDENFGTVATPYLQRLRDVITETVGLHLRRDDDRICIAEITAPHAFRMMAGVGRTYPMHAGAAGKAILAFLPDAEVDRLLAEPIDWVWTTPPPNIRKLRRELAIARKQGYATSFSETVPGANALAAPVFSSRGVIGSINITGPDQRWTTARIQEAVPEVLAVSNMLSRQFGWVPE
jgi:DNA-binding IclR family transcriptional regulator